MKYILCLNARPVEAVSIEVKHDKFVTGLISIDGPWGLAAGDYPVPDIGAELSVHFPIGKRLRGRGVRGFVNYRYRGGLRDDSGCDDYINLEFNPERVDFGGLVEAALPGYIEAFDPYFGYVADEEFVFTDFNRSRDANFRHSILRVFPICYISRSLCAEVLGLSLEEVSRRVSNKTKSVRMVAGGILITGQKEPLDFASAKILSDELSTLIGVRLA